MPIATAIAEARAAANERAEQAAADAAGWADRYKEANAAAVSLAEKLAKAEAELAAYRNGDTLPRSEFYKAAVRFRDIEAESEGRRQALLDKAEELRREWTRAENAEGTLVEAMKLKDYWHEREIALAYKMLEAEARERRLREALTWALDYGDFDVAADNPMHAKALREARAALADEPQEARRD